MLEEQQRLQTPCMGFNRWSGLHSIYSTSKRWLVIQLLELVRYLSLG